jgi:hypothetical protein
MRKKPTKIPRAPGSGLRGAQRDELVEIGNGDLLVMDLIDPSTSVPAFCPPPRMFACQPAGNNAMPAHSHESL